MHTCTYLNVGRPSYVRLVSTRDHMISGLKKWKAWEQSYVCEGRREEGEEGGGEDKRKKGIIVPSQQSVVRMCPSGTC